jgi:hypothetical protein
MLIVYFCLWAKLTSIPNLEKLMGKSCVTEFNARSKLIELLKPSEERHLVEIK